MLTPAKTESITKNKIIKVAQQASGKAALSNIGFHQAQAMIGGPTAKTNISVRRR